MSVTLDEVMARVDAVHQDVRQIRLKTGAAVLSRQDAAEYVGVSERWGFDPWRKRWGVKPVSRGRFARVHLDQAMRKEARG